MYLAEYFPRLDSVVISADSGKHGNSKIGLQVTDSVSRLVIDDVPITLPIDTYEGIEDIKLLNCKQIDDRVSVTLKVPQSAKEGSDTSSKSFMNYSAPSLSSSASSAFVQKWSVKDLRNKTHQDEKTKRNQFKFNCAHCHGCIIDSNSQSFFDMPSELWAEMMEFWHCHKPNLNIEDVKEVPYYKGIVKPVDEKEVVIGSYYVLLRRSNQDIVRSQEKDCLCSSCHTVIGEYLDDISIPNKEYYFKINKWDLELEHKGPGSVERYEKYIYVYNILMDKINSLAVRKFYINGKYFAWVINIGINVSTGGKVYKNALKVMFKELPTEFRDEEGDNGNVEVIELPDEIESSFVDKLMRINESLPNGNKKMSIKDENGELIEYNVSYVPSN